MIRSWERLVWAALLLLSLSVGAVNVIGQKEGGAKAWFSKHGGADAAGSQSEKSSSSRGGSRDEARVRKVTNQALSTPSRVERFHRVMGVLDDTTAENWKSIWHEYIRQTLKEGRVHESEWGLFMNRVGEVAGPEAMEYFTHNAQNDHTFNRSTVLTGWASVDPQAAYDWLTRMPVEEQKPEFWHSLLEGASARDPQLALDWLGKIPAEYARGVTGQIVSSQIQSRGLQETIGALESLVSHIPEGAPMPEYLQTFHMQLRNRAQRMEWLSEAFPEMESMKPDFEKLDERFGFVRE